MRPLARYRKLIACLLGVGALVAMQYFDISIPGYDAVVLTLIIGAAQAFGVYQARNDG